MLTSAILLAAALPFSQAWSDTGLISRDDDWSGVAGLVGHRGDGLTSAPGADPRLLAADGTGTPVDVNANEPDPRAVGLAAGVTEFELPDPVVALQGSATAAAPHLVLSLETRGHSGVTVRYRLRDIDASGSNAVHAVALQYRVGASGDFAGVPGGFVADATTGPGAATLVTPVSAVLPAAAEDKPLVQLRILTTNAVGQDEWVGVDDIEVEASGMLCVPPAPPPSPSPWPPEPPSPSAGSPAVAASRPPTAHGRPVPHRPGALPDGLHGSAQRPGRQSQRASGDIPQVPPFPIREGRLPCGEPTRRRAPAGPVLDSRPQGPQPPAIQRKAARPRSAVRCLPPDCPGDRPRRYGFRPGDRGLPGQVKL